MLSKENTNMMCLFLQTMFWGHFSRANPDFSSFVFSQHDTAKLGCFFF